MCTHNPAARAQPPRHTTGVTTRTSQEGGAVETVPGSALEVTRTATRDNKSQYFIAGKKSNFTGVTDLLKAKGVDLNNNRFLILQARRRTCDARVRTVLGTPGRAVRPPGASAMHVGPLDSHAQQSTVRARAPVRQVTCLGTSCCDNGAPACGACGRRAAMACAVAPQSAAAPTPRHTPPGAQGEVEQIAMMKAKGEDKNEAGLLEYLEDIIGTDQYVAAIEEAAARLEGLSEARQAAVHRVKRAGAPAACDVLTHLAPSSA